MEHFDHFKNLSSQNCREPSGHGLRVWMVSYSFYESDNRVMRYAEALAKRGDLVDVISLREGHYPSLEIVRGVRVHRIQERKRDEKKKFDYLSKISRFLIHSAYILSRESLKKPYHLVHVHSVPDFEVFAAILPKLRGAKVLLDIHDIVPEFYASKFNNGRSETPLFRALTAIEKISASFSDHVIISNHLWAEKLVARSVRPEKCSVILNYPDPSLFHERPRARQNDKFVMLYPGSLNRHQGLDIAIKAFSTIRDKVPHAQFHIYGSGGEQDHLMELIKQNGLQEIVILKEPVPIDQVAAIMSDADLGIIPKRNDPFGGDAFSTKSLEFMSLGVPLIMSRTNIDQYYFNDSVVRFFEPGNIEALASAMLEMITKSDLRKTQSEKALKFVEDFSWDKKKSEYLALVDRLVNSKKT